MDASEERNHSDRAVAFENLTAGQREEFRKAVECNCSVEAVAFGFGTEQQVHIVAYNDDYYFVYVSKV